MRYLDELDLVVNDLMDFEETCVFSDNYTGTIKVNLTGLPLWFDKIVGVRIFIDGVVIFSDTLTKLTEIVYPKKQGELRVKLMTFCPSCAKKSKEQQLKGEVFP